MLSDTLIAVLQGQQGFDSSNDCKECGIVQDKALGMFAPGPRGIRNHYQAIIHYIKNAVLVNGDLNTCQVGPQLQLSYSTVHHIYCLGG